MDATLTEASGRRCAWATFIVRSGGQVVLYATFVI
jgi:hypothetical protein